MATDERLELLSLLLQVVSGVGQRTADRLDRHGLTTVDLDVLVSLLAAGEGDADRRPIMSEVAARTGLTPSGTTRVVDRLTGRGLVTRSACPTDRRITHVELSPAGRALLDAALPDHLDVVETTLAGPLRGAGELASFTAQLRRLRDSLSAPVPAADVA